MGQREHISAACIMRAWNKVIHGVPFKMMGVWAKDHGDEAEYKAREIKRLPVPAPLRAVHLMECSLNTIS